jgi:hypothetical protein
MSYDVFSEEPEAPNRESRIQKLAEPEQCQTLGGSAEAWSLRGPTPASAKKYLAPSRGRFRFRAMKDNYEKMKTHTSQTKATHVAAPALLISAISKARKAALLLFSVAILLTGATTGRGQSALDGVDPNANGAIRVVAVQPNGQILLGGEFTTLSPNGGATTLHGSTPTARLTPLSTRMRTILSFHSRYSRTAGF